MSIFSERKPKGLWQITPTIQKPTQYYKRYWEKYKSIRNQKTQPLKAENINKKISYITAIMVYTYF